MNQKEKILDYISASCGIGKYYSSRLVLLRKLKRTRSPRWAGMPVPDLIFTLEQILSDDGLNVKEIH